MKHGQQEQLEKETTSVFVTSATLAVIVMIMIMLLAVVIIKKNSETNSRVSQQLLTGSTIYGDTKCPLQNDTKAFEVSIFHILYTRENSKSLIEFIRYYELRLDIQNI